MTQRRGPKPRARAVEDVAPSLNAVSMSLALRRLSDLNVSAKTDLQSECGSIVADFIGALHGERREAYSALVALRLAIENRVANLKVRKAAQSALAPKLEGHLLSGRYNPRAEPSAIVGAVGSGSGQEIR